MADERPPASATAAPAGPGAVDAAETAETAALRERYARRGAGIAARYGLLDPAALRERQGRQRALAALLKAHGAEPSALDLVEIGCGHGGNLLELLQFGFAPERLQGVELLEERLEAARRLLPPALRLHAGDACALALPEASQDLVLLATVFSSILDDAFQQRVADTAWRWLRPGGAVLCYDFGVANPRNPDVRGVPPARLRALFPQARIASRRLTLAPPLARALARLHPALCAPFEALALLRTHHLSWIGKPRA